MGAGDQCQGLEGKSVGACQPEVELLERGGRPPDTSSHCWRRQGPTLLSFKLYPLFELRNNIHFIDEETEAQKRSCRCCCC